MIEGLTHADVGLLRTSVHLLQRAAEADCTAAGYREACPECQRAVDDAKARMTAIADKLEALLSFGFTWEDVRFLQAVAADAANLVRHDDRFRNNFTQANSLADRIASVLPPQADGD